MFYFAWYLLTWLSINSRRISLHCINFLRVMDTQHTKRKNIIPINQLSKTNAKIITISMTLFCLLSFLESNKTAFRRSGQNFLLVRVLRY